MHRSIVVPTPYIIRSDFSLYIIFTTLTECRCTQAFGTSTYIWSERFVVSVVNNLVEAPYVMRTTDQGGRRRLLAERGKNRSHFYVRVSYKSLLAKQKFSRYQCDGLLR